MLLDASLLNTQHYKVRIKGKWIIPGKVKHPPLHLGAVDIEKGAFSLPSTMVSQLNLEDLWICLNLCNVNAHFLF